ncbi:MAG: ester cyclase [Polyangiaceae bacterium]|nr:ester cyclase [Myxococcales bacterium]MCB9590529.1 ester cyclase [Polyangiaceae bacterium]MCB9608524.1 ester cyclase [Polyangiaceae bacterium]
MSDSKVQVIKRYYEQLFNEGELELVDELLHPDYVNHSPGSPEQPRNRAAVKDVVRELRDAFPDLHYTIEQLVVGEDSVAVRTTLRGTQCGPFYGNPPSKRSVEVSQITIERFLEGRIVAHHRLTDELALLRQLGLIG